MANTTLNTVIKLRYDSYENWQANSTVVLQAGEAGICTIPADTGTGLNEPATLMKIGNGTSTWAELPWVSGLAADVIPSLKGSSPTLPATSITGLDDYIAGKIEDTNTTYQLVQDGDMGIKLQSKEINGEWTDVGTITLNPSTAIQTAIQALDAAAVTAGQGEIISEVSETDGVVSIKKRSLVAADIPALTSDKISDFDDAVGTAISEAIADVESPTNPIRDAVEEVVDDKIGNIGESTDVADFVGDSINTAMSTLNLNAVTAGTGQVIGQIQQTQGAVTAQLKTLTADDIPEIPQSKVTNLTTTLAGKQDTIVFNTAYDSASNKAATMTDITNSVNTVKTELIGTPDDASSLNTINAVKKYASEQIAAQIGSAYKAAGSTAFADLPTPEEAIEGYVYNVTDAFTADTKFITSEQSKQYPAGTNVVVVEVPGVEEAPSTYAYDVLTGMVDLSAYATTSAMTSAIDAAKTELIGTGNTTASTIKGAGDEAKAYADTLNTAMDTRVEALETAVGETPVATQITNAIQALDVASQAVTTGNKITAIEQVDGKISVTTGAITSDDIPELAQSKITGLTAALAGKQDTLTMDGTYNAESNKVATQSTVTNAIGALDFDDTAVAHQFITEVNENGGIISVQRAALTADDIPDLTASKITDLDTTISGAIDEAITTDGAIDEAISGAVTEAIAGVAGTVAAVENNFVTSISMANGVLTGTVAQPTVANINGLQTALNAKADTSSLGYFATGTNATRLTLDSGDYLILNGGGAAGF